MTMKKEDVKILKKYSDKYVAYVGKFLNILASGTTIKEVEKELKKKKIEKATITYISPVDKAFSPLCQ